MTNIKKSKSSKKAEKNDTSLDEVVNDNKISEVSAEEKVLNLKKANDVKDSNKVKLQKNDEVRKMTNELKDNDRVYYGDSSEVIAVDHQDYNDFVKHTESNQEMPGFDDKYRDVVDYVLKITHEIWEEKGIGVIYDTYHNDITMHTSTTTLVGVKDVIANTLMTLHAFPDRRLIGEDVVWSKYDTKGFLSSHRILSTATNLGDSGFGPATGRKINFRTVVDCAMENNRIYEEWLVRDNLWMVQQLGFDVHEVAKALVKANVSKVPALQSEYGLAENMYGQYVPARYEAKDDSVGEWLKEALDGIFNYKMINTVKNHYAPEAVVHYICNQDLYGYENIQGMLISFLGSIPNGHYYVDRVTVNDRRGDDCYQVAVRWRLKGLNEGIGAFGAPTNKPISILGIDHYRIRNKKIVEQWVTYDGLDVLRQIYQDDAVKEANA